MQQLTQTNRFITISDLGFGNDAFLVTGFKGFEVLGGLFDFTVDILSDHLDLVAEDVLGKPATLTLHTSLHRHFSGYVGALTFGEIESHNLRRYQLALVPWLWFSSHRHNCRIFHKKNAKTIVSEIFEEAGFRAFSFLAAGGNVRDYCVQYNESDLDFVSRLLEEEGISYFFKHFHDRHQLVLVDQSAHLEEITESNLEYCPAVHTGPQVSAWQKTTRLGKGRWSHHRHQRAVERRDEYHDQRCDSISGMTSEVAALESARLLKHDQFDTAFVCEMGSNTRFCIAAACVIVGQRAPRSQHSAACRVLQTV